MPNIHIVTVATKPGGYLKWLEESCVRNGSKLTILGMGEEWKGYITKYILMQNFLKTVDKQDIVCFVDAYDVLMVNHIDKLMEKFLKITENTDYKMICASDCISKSDNNIIDDIMLEISLIRMKASKQSRICSGTYIGYVYFLEEAYNWMIQEYTTTGEKDDQVLLQLFYLNTTNIYIDKDSMIFLTQGSQELFHHFTKKEDDNYVFLHKVRNQEMITDLLFYGYSISYEEIIEVINCSINESTCKNIYHSIEFFKKLVSRC